MQNFAINSGSFSANGNFSGYSKKALNFGDKSGRIFISKRQMDALGFTSIDKVTFPFYVTATEREFSKVDANNQPTGETFKRLTTFSAYKTKEELVASEVAEATLDIEVSTAVKSAASAAGLSEQAINALLSVA